MTNYRYSQLDLIRFPLIVRFYKTYYPAGKPKKDEIIWTVENNQGLCGAVRFRQFMTFQLLTGMVITPHLRRQKLGDSLLEASQAQTLNKPCYCLAFRYLIPLYQQRGFSIINAESLPKELKGRYISYCNSGKDLTPMKHH